MTSDKAILERHDVGVRPRARMELKIVNLLLELCKKEGYTVKISEYENDGGRTPKDLKGAIFNLDEARLFLSKNGEGHGWVYLVFGNDGFDLVSDYTVNLDGFLKPVMELADRLENGKE